MAGKAKSIAIKLVSTAGTGFFYATKKNPRNVPAKLSLKKVSVLLTVLLFPPDIAWLMLLLLCSVQYDPVVRKHVIFTESKMK